MKNRDLTNLFRKTKKWEEFIEWDYAPTLFGDSKRIVLTLIETGQIIGRADSYEEMDEVAEQILNNIFENEVLK